MEYLYLELNTTGASPLYSRISEIKALRFDSEKEPPISHFVRTVNSLSDEKKALEDFKTFAKGCNYIAYLDDFTLAYIHDCLRQYKLEDYTSGFESIDVDKAELQKFISMEDVLSKCEIFTGELKHFYPDYKNYYYLPYEDYAVYKSIGENVDKSARIKATRETAYTKKAGTFIPAPKNADVHLFKKAYDDTESYCLISDISPRIMLHLILKS